MNQIVRFAAAAGLALQNRAPKGPFFVDYAVRVVGGDDEPAFELWRRVEAQQPLLVGKYDHFATAQEAAQQDLGREIPDRLWREADANEWPLRAS